MTVYQIIAVLLSLAACGEYINHRFIKLPSTIGHMAFALLISLLAVALGGFGLIDLAAVSAFVRQIDFSEVLLHGMLSFLLFAGALHIDIRDLKSVKIAVSVLATFGVAIATLLIGTLVWFMAGFTGLHLSYIYALLFGALISPTDPIAVLAMLKESKASKKLYARIGGESLFNDGVGVVVFLTILHVATGAESAQPSSIIVALLREVVGGLMLGSILGFAAYRLLRSVDDYKVEVMLTLALVTGGYAIGEYIHVSAPICMVVAGLIVGNHGRKRSISHETRTRLDVFWELIDEILNAVLFMLIGFESVVIPLPAPHVFLGLLSIFAALFGRFVSVALPLSCMKFFARFESGTIRLLTWGGLRGGLSVAMALSLPAGDEKSMILPMTYIVVLFSILVQGLTFPRMLKYLQSADT